MFKSGHDVRIAREAGRFAMERARWSVERSDLQERIGSLQSAQREMAPKITGANQLAIGLAEMDAVKSSFESKTRRLERWASKALGVTLDGPEELALERIAKEMSRREWSWRIATIKDLKHYGFDNGDGDHNPCGLLRRLWWGDDY
jgi:hypothetical protein